VKPDIRERLPSLQLHSSAVDANGEDGGYGVIESDFFYCVLAAERPSRVVQVGCGVSTAVALRARSEQAIDMKITCVEPFPTPYLEALGASEQINLIKSPAQEVPMEVLADLDSGDLLFIDSTHTVSVGSEVNRLILEVLPRLRPGVIVHFHDIHFPFDYGRTILSGDMFFWSESTLLHAFLAGSECCEILVSLSMLHYGAKDALRELMPNYVPQSDDQGLRGSEGLHFPSSTYLRMRTNA
jgi:hypothetical protein